MFTDENVIIFLIIAWVFIYTVSYGVWIWRRKNRLGATAVFLVALSVLLLPLITYTLR